MHALIAAWQSFWFERTILKERLLALRVVFFGILGVDLLHLMVEKAYRYGADGFNVAHFDLLDRLLPLPNALIHTCLYLIAGFLAFRVAAGIAIRSSLYLLTLFYAYCYFSSMHDGYQHHYLLGWMTLLFWFMPIDKVGVPGAQKAGDSTAENTLIPAWGMGMFYAQVSIVYFFTAMAKMNANWFNGWALRQQISTPWLRDAFEAINQALSLPGYGVYGVVATSVFAWQVLASLSFLMPKLRPIACISGPLFHVAVELTGLEIRWFSYYMIALYYLMLFPDAWFIKTLSWLRRALAFSRGFLRRVWDLLAQPLPYYWPMVMISALLSGILAGQVPLPGAEYVGMAVGGLVFASALIGGPKLLRYHLILQILFAFWVAAIPQNGGAAYNYYRYQGGDFLRRNQIDEAIEAYYSAIELNPGPKSRHAKLGQILVARGRIDAAIEVYEAGLKQDPKDERLLKGLEKAKSRQK